MVRRPSWQASTNISNRELGALESPRPNNGHLNEDSSLANIREEVLLFVIDFTLFEAT